MAAKQKDNDTRTNAQSSGLESRHTPGPWSSCNQDTGKIAVFSDSEYHQRICEMDDLTIGMGPINNATTGSFGNRPTGTFGHEGDFDRRKANARLIAAAPDLLEVCKAMRKSIRHAHTCRGPKAFPCSCDADMLWNQSAAAIAKAEGSAQ